MHVQKLMHAASTLCNTIVHYFDSMGRMAVPTKNVKSDNVAVICNALRALSHTCKKKA